jgi:hypothetical protein
LQRFELAIDAFAFAGVAQALVDVVGSRGTDGVEHTARTQVASATPASAVALRSSEPAAVSCAAIAVLRTRKRSVRSRKRSAFSSSASRWAWMSPRWRSMLPGRKRRVSR